MGYKSGVPAKRMFCGEPHSGFPSPKQEKRLPPSREPTISGDTIGARARATALRHLCGAANYATCNAPASRRDGALPAYDTSSPRHSLRRRRTCKRSFRPCASFGWAAPAPNKCTSCIRTLRMRRYNANSTGVWGNNSPTERRAAKRRADCCGSSHTSCYSTKSRVRYNATVRGSGGIIPPQSGGNGRKNAAD